MKKSTVATLILACAISGMLLLLTNQYCTLFPLFGEWCQVHERLGFSQESAFVHHGEMNTWHDREPVEFEGWTEFNPEEFAGDVDVSQNCEVGESVAHALGNGEESTALDRLEFMALHSTCLEARKAAVQAIGGFGSDEARAALVRILWAVSDV